MTNEDMEIYEDAPVADRDIQEVMNLDIENAPRDSHELKERLEEHNATSPETSGGDIDAEWEDAQDSGAESVGGHNPTPGQSDAEANAKAMGIEFQDNQPLDMIGKLEKRDEDRFELDPNSKADDESI